MPYLPLIVHLVSILLWIPGIFMYPIVSFAFSLGGGGGFFSSMLGMSEKVELSIWESIKELATMEQWTVVFLISFFSLAIPLIKAGLLFYVQLRPNAAKTGSIRKGVASVSKWAMADVFAVGIIIAGLSSFEAGASIKAQTEAGFYFFASYVLLSTLSAQLTLRASKYS